MRPGIAATIAVLAVLAAVGIGLAAVRFFAQPPAPIRVLVTFTPAPTASPTPYDEAALFHQPISGGCATSAGVWVITNGGGLLRFDGSQWAQVDSTLRSLTRAACSPDTAYAVGLVGALVVSEEQTRQIRSTDVTIDDLFGVAPLPAGALMVGSRGTVFVLDNGDIQPFAQGIDEDLFGVVAFSLQSAWAVGDHGITYRLDQRGWAPIASGQGNALRAIAGLTPAGVIAVGDKGTIVGYDGGWKPLVSGVDVTLRDVTVGAGLWIAGDGGTLLTTGTTVGTFRRVDLKTSCDLVSLFAASGDLWVVGRGPTDGGVWRLRNGAVNLHFGGC
jgi:hypothetical protein